MKFLKKSEDLPIRISFEPIGNPSSAGSLAVWLAASVVGSDGYIREEEENKVWFGTIRKTSRELKFFFEIGDLVRWGDDPRKAQNHLRREFTFPRSFFGPTARKNLHMMSDRLGLLLTPQHRSMFHGVPIRKLCVEIYDLICVQEVMET